MKGRAAAACAFALGLAAALGAAGQGIEIRENDRLCGEGDPREDCLRLESEPAGAEVYLSWKLVGKTPLELRRQPVRGLLVVAADGYRARYQPLDLAAERSPLYVRLAAERGLPLERAVLAVAGDGASAVFDRLWVQVNRAGFRAVGEERGAELADAAGEAAWRPGPGAPPRALLEWAKARFDSRFLLFAEVEGEGKARKVRFCGLDLREGASAAGGCEPFVIERRALEVLAMEAASRFADELLRAEP